MTKQETVILQKVHTRNIEQAARKQIDQCWKAVN